MKMWKVRYKIKNQEYTDVFVSRNMRSVRFKLSMNHRCDIHAIKILDSEVIMDNVKE